MNVFYAGRLNGCNVKVDEVNVHVDATRYPVRNIAMVHVEKAEKPGFVIARSMCLIPLFFFVACLTAGSAESVIVWFDILLIAVFTCYHFIVLRCHSVKFGNSASDKHVVALFPTSKKRLRSYINPIKSLDWESMSAPSYQEVLEFANAVSSSIGSLQNKERSSR
jgi:hypothetical protein